MYTTQAIPLDNVGMLQKHTKTQTNATIIIHVHVLHCNIRCETLEHTAVKTNLSVLFDRYVPILQVDLANTLTSQLSNIQIMLII